MMRPLASGCLRAAVRSWLFLVVLVGGEAARGQDRLNWTTPGLILETGAPTGTTDVLEFTPDGKTLLAAGDDKVVRAWAVLARNFSSSPPQVLRWPVYRERRGCIHCMARFDPDINRLV